MKIGQGESSALRAVTPGGPADIGECLPGLEPSRLSFDQRLEAENAKLRLVRSEAEAGPGPHPQSAHHRPSGYEWQPAGETLHAELPELEPVAKHEQTLRVELRYLITVPIARGSVLDVLV